MILLNGAGLIGCLTLKPADIRHTIMEDYIDGHQSEIGQAAQRWQKAPNVAKKALVLSRGEPKVRFKRGMIS